MLTRTVDKATQCEEAERTFNLAGGGNIWRIRAEIDRLHAGVNEKAVKLDTLTAVAKDLVEEIQTQGTHARWKALLNALMS